MTAIALAARRPAQLRLTKGRAIAVLLGAAAVVYVVFQGSFQLPLDTETSLFQRLNDVRDWFNVNRDAPLFAVLITPLRQAIDTLVVATTGVLTAVGWLGITAVAGALGLMLVTWRTALLVAGALVLIALMGLWDATIVTLGQVIVAVAIALLIGIPLGIWAGRSDRVLHLVTPVLDLMQIMPSYAYLAPLALFFLIGNATATVATMIYAIPPAIRLTAMGIRGVSAETVEAATSLGSTSSQVLRKVQLPMARTTVGLAVNQTIMMALSMVVITALVGAGGLGDKIIRGLITLNTGAAFDAGIAIVLLAMILDRLTASASQVAGRRQTGADQTTPARRRALLAAGVGIAVVGIVLGLAVDQAHTFPADWHFSFADPVNAIVGWVETNLAFLTDALKNVVSAWFLDPIQTVLTSSPWWLVVGVAAGLALIVTGLRAAIVVTVASLLIIVLQVWEPAMETLTQVLVGVVVTLVIGVTMGTWAARSNLVSQILRPINDAAQTMPAFVYLLPAVALFQPTRFSAILAAVIYAIPAVIRLVEDGVRNVSPTAIEAAESAGSTTFQVIRKVQLPMARRSLLTATNQGVVMVLAMVVVGGLVGGGALGYRVVSGLSQASDFGIGMSSALAIVLLGVMLDRITQGAGARRETVSSEE